MPVITIRHADDERKTQDPDTMRPLIGILLDYEAEGSFSKRPHNALRCAYFDAIDAAGGLPVGLGYVAGTSDALLERLDGLVLPGGFYPFPAPCYGEPDNGAAAHPRAAFERTLTERALERDLPVLGICAGMQVLGLLRGAVIHRDIHKVVDTAIDHLNERPAEETAHDVEVVPGTLLHAITAQARFAVNTAHREGFTELPAGVTASAFAPDGVIEALELNGYRFALGVQWHPEFFLGTGDPNRRIFDIFVKVAAGASPPARVAAA